MRLLFSTIAFLLSCQMAFGQLDSLNIPPALDSAKFKVNSFQQKVNGKMDSVTNPIKTSVKNNILIDTVASIHKQLDSIQNGLNTRVDSITNSYSSVLTKIQTSAQRYQTKIDSLQSFKLPTDKYKSKWTASHRS